jgi:membrane-associated phospholipid phosphatase
MSLMRFVYANDRSYNALPSGHTYNTMMIAIIWWVWKPRQRLLWSLSVPIVILSTLFARQHNVLDAVFGVIWALGAFIAASMITGWREKSV